MNTKLRRAVLVDPFPLWLDAVAGVVERTGVEVVGRAGTAHSAQQLIDALQPDLLVIETDLDGGAEEGLECLRRAHARHPSLCSIVLSIRGDAPAVEAALFAGATAYVVKSAHPEDLSSAIRQVLFDVSVYFKPTNGSAAPATNGGSPPSTPLTKRESEILALVADGSANAEIARRLWVTEQTVKFHLSNIYRKLEVSNRTEAARWAHQSGLTSAPLPTLSVA
jgi:two-component system, NarL family, response regulator DevR